MSGVARLAPFPDGDRRKVAAGAGGRPSAPGATGRRRPIRGVRGLGLLLAGAAAAAGCSRLDAVGRAPDLTPPGAPQAPAPAVAPRHVALSTPPMREAPPPYAVASLWRSGPESLFGDRRARGLGDIMTVVIEIDDQAEFRNASERRRSADEDLSVSALFGVPSLLQGALDFSTDPGVGIGSTSSTTGEGSVRRGERITLRVAATVVDVLPNGHLVVAGAQEVRVNYELRDLQVTGIVRPADISRRNEITYDKIAEARISYGGRGQITDVQQPRLGQQVLDVLLPF